MLGLIACVEPGSQDSVSDEDSALQSPPLKASTITQCPANAACAWSGNNFNGTFSQWPAGDTDCHNHVNNPDIRSAFNNTGFRVRFGGLGPSGPGMGFQLANGSLPMTGLICWPV
jgi:Peptidase inhibitor family I36